MREKVVLCLDFGVTTVTKLGHLLTFYLLLRPLMQFVTIETAHVIQGMGAGVPVGERGDGSR